MVSFKKVGFGTILTIVVVVFLLYITWPKLQLQVGFDNAADHVNVYSPDFFKMQVGIWNRGGIVSDWKLITPESCIWASGFSEYNFSCTHTGFSGVSSCSTAICGTSPAGIVGFNDLMKINLPSNNRPSNFTFTIFSTSNWGPLKLKDLSLMYRCEWISGQPAYGNYYNCTTS